VFSGLGPVAGAVRWFRR